MYAKTNDRLRSDIPFITPPNLLVITRGIAALGYQSVAEILQVVRNFDCFDENNDPWGQHDFGSFDYKDEIIFWKIDDYDGQEGYDLVLTVMLAIEY